jgi:SynChlorMet cassette protein ScmC
MPRLLKNVGFSLANETKLGFVAGDKPTSKILSSLKEIMQLKDIVDPVLEATLLYEGTFDNLNNKIEGTTELDTEIEYMFPKNTLWTISPRVDKDAIVCTMNKQLIESDFALQLHCIFIIIGLIALNRGGMLIHGALAARDDKGIILAGRSGVGKTTASNRLPKPWQSLCDDLTLVVRDSRGTYWAHPLPTYSRFRDGTGGKWDVQHAVPLKGIFFLYQNEKDCIHPLEVADGLRLLVFSAIQAVQPLLKTTNQESQRTLYTQIFDKGYALCHTVPTYYLDLSLTGKFWLGIERALNGECLSKVVEVYAREQ